MPAEQLLPSADRLLTNENIAIAVLSFVVLLLVGGIIAQFTREREKDKAHNAQLAALADQYHGQVNLLIENFRSDMKEVWGHASKIIESVREVTTEIKLQSAAAAARHQSGGSRGG